MVQQPEKGPRVWLLSHMERGRWEPASQPQLPIILSPVPLPLVHGPTIQGSSVPLPRREGDTSVLEITDCDIKSSEKHGFHFPGRRTFITPGGPCRRHHRTKIILLWHRRSAPLASKKVNP